MKYSYLAIILSFVISLALGYQLIDISKSLKAQNRLNSGSFNISDLDVNKDGNISDEDINNFFTERFKKSGDGSLDPWTYETVLGSIVNETKRKNTDGHFKKIDSNGDNSISYEEYVAFNGSQVKYLINQQIQLFQKRQTGAKMPSKPQKLKPVQFKKVSPNESSEQK